MLTKIKNMNKFKLYIISISLVYLILVLIMLFFGPSKETYAYKNYEYKKSTIEEKNDKYEISVSYPRYSKEKITEIITNYVYGYVSEFKKTESEIKKTLSIEYKIEDINGYSNILFKIKNSIKPNDKYKNIIINSVNEKEVLVSELYGEDFLNEIKELVNKKYSESIHNEIIELKLDDFNYSFNKDYINIYISKSSINSSINYDLYVTKVLNEKYTFKEEYSENTKYISFTFDDGPSEYTKEMVDALVSNNSSATFFMLGNRMKVYPELVSYAVENGMEIGSHTYSHKNLTNISDDEVLEEINSTQIIFNNITGKNIVLTRPPYGAYNEKVQNLSLTPLIIWSVDPYDWLHRDTAFVVEHILNNIKDGDIILMHDLYPTTVEAVKVLLPELNNIGYKIVSVSKLAEIKEKNLVKGEIIREIK